MRGAHTGGTLPVAAVAVAVAVAGVVAVAVVKWLLLLLLLLLLQFGVFIKLFALLSLWTPHRREGVVSHVGATRNSKVSEHIRFGNTVTRNHVYELRRCLL